MTLSEFLSQAGSDCVNGGSGDWPHGVSGVSRGDSRPVETPHSSGKSSAGEAGWGRVGSPSVALSSGSETAPGHRAGVTHIFPGPLQDVDAPHRDGLDGQPWFQGESVTLAGSGSGQLPGARLLLATGHGADEQGGGVMRKTRDLTDAQFRAALNRYGFEPEGFFGYVRLPAPNRHVSVSILNAGTRRRDQLAYLLQQADAHGRGH